MSGFVGAFWGTRALEIVKRNNSPGLLWKRIKLTTTRKANAKKRLRRVWLHLDIGLHFSLGLDLHLHLVLVKCIGLAWGHLLGLGLELHLDLGHRFYPGVGLGLGLSVNLLLPKLKLVRLNLVSSKEDKVKGFSTEYEVEGSSAEDEVEVSSTEDDVEGSSMEDEVELSSLGEMRIAEVSRSGFQQIAASLGNWKL
ncbi:hypothetical protein COCNU_scaffold002930G000010 [Cocos nucifera]|nr:hypothetical protein [Cocos nucifera]